MEAARRDRVERDELAVALEQLDERRAAAIREAYAGGRGLPMEAIARTWGISHQRVSQILAGG